VTLAIAVATADGIVVAADSRTTFNPTDQPQRVLSDFTHKVFRVGNCAVATYGFAFLLGRNVAGHMATLAGQVANDDLPPNEMAERIKGYFGDLLEQHFAAGNDERPPPGGDVLGFLVGGYEGPSARVYDVTLPTAGIMCVTPDGVGAGWRGQTDVLARVLFGLDLGSVDLVLRDKRGRLKARDTALLQRLSDLSPLTQYIVLFDGMNLQDAVDFAFFAIRTTIDVQRLTYGIAGKPGSWPGVGGPIEIAAVTALDGFSWVQQTVLHGERPAGIAEV
jgi:hypothetical protein